MASSCSHWWHAPIYVTISIALAIVAISTPSSHSSSNNPKPQTQLQTPLSITHQLSTNASRSLRNSGFTFMATLLQISPELFLPPSESTLFVIHDTSISNLSLPPWLMKDLLHYHTCPSKLSSTDLLNQPQGSCLPTLLNTKNLSITKSNPQERLIAINGVLISHPDIFSQGLYSIHGVAAPFFSINPLEQQEPDWDFIQSPICGENSSVLANAAESRNKIQWNRIHRLLSSNGYISFAIGLHSVLDRILHEYADLNNVTIFAPLNFGYLASPSPTLERIVRSHILPERLDYDELLSLPVKASLRTLVGENGVEITKDFSERKMISVNGVEITAPDVLSSKEFVVHGISKPFDMVELWSALN